MNHAGRRWILFFGFLAMAGLVLFLAGNAWAQPPTQQRSVQHLQTGPEEVEVRVNHGTVVLVEGNHLVLRREDGSLEALFIPESFRFDLEGQQISVHELKPGMIITEEVVSRTKPTTVRTVEILDGTVWHRIGNRVIIRGRNGKVTAYTIPEWATIMVDGREQTVNELEPDMKINATIITEEPFTEVTEERRTHAQYPSRSAAATVTPEHRTEVSHGAATGETAEANPAPAEPAGPPAAAEELPRTASPLPLIGVTGLLFLAASLGFGALRRLG